MQIGAPLSLGEAHHGCVGPSASEVLSCTSLIPKGAAELKTTTQLIGSCLVMHISSFHHPKRHPVRIWPTAPSEMPYRLCASRLGNQARCLGMSRRCSEYRFANFTHHHILTLLTLMYCSRPQTSAQPQPCFCCHQDSCEQSCGPHLQAVVALSKEEL